MTKPPLEIRANNPQELEARLPRVSDLSRKGILGGPITITLGRPKRSNPQNRKFHALIGDIAKSLDFQGKKYSTEVWKAWLVDQFEEELKAMGRSLAKPSQVMPSLDGRRVITIRASTTGFTKGVGSEFIEFLYAWGIAEGVTFSEESIGYHEEACHQLYKDSGIGRATEDKKRNVSEVGEVINLRNNSGTWR